MKIKLIKDIFPNIHVARFNLAVWQKPSGESLYFIGREVAHAGGTGEPDTGILKFFEVTVDGSHVQEKVIWKPVYEGINLEDPRALELPGENLIIGLTAVLRDKNGHPIPFPAIVKIDSIGTWKKELPPFLIIDSFGPGKNLTPVDKTTYLFALTQKNIFINYLCFHCTPKFQKNSEISNFPKTFPGQNGESAPQCRLFG
jgi:hypothetical protein